LKPVGSNNSSPVGDEVEEKFRTGYWLEGNTIVFSTFVYDNTRRGIEERKKKKTSKSVTDSYMSAAKNLQAGFRQKMQADLLFKEKSKKELIVYYTNKKNASSDNNEKSKLEIQINKLIANLDEIEKEKTLVSTYSFDFRWQVVDTVKYEYKYMFSDKELPLYYYMNLNDGSGDEGGTHPNPNNRLSSVFFNLGIPNNQFKASRTLLHESLHPVIEHIAAYGDSNPMSLNFFKLLKDTLIELKRSQSDNLVVIAQIKAEFKYEIKVILDNIMTTPEVKQLYPDVIPYLGDSDVSSQLNNGTSLHVLQLKKILELI
jgi:hypothetical protein